MRILFLGEIVGKGGIYTIKNMLDKVKRDRSVDFVIANGNGVTGGFGMGMNHSIYLHKLGIDVITTGECVYYKKDMSGHISHASYIHRAANFPPGNPGRGWGIHKVGDKQIAVLNFLGLSGYSRIHLNNPFSYITEVIKRVKEKTSVVIVNFHGATTAEKQSMAFHLDGKVTACLGTGQKCLTADASIMENGTFSITDCGRTGSSLSVGGLEKKVEIDKFLYQIPKRSDHCMDGLEMQGVLMDIDYGSGRVTDYEVLRLPMES